MDEADARRVLLLRAVEEGGAMPAWREADGEWATEQARREVGDSAATETFLAARARRACSRLLEREPGLAVWLPSHPAPSRTAAWKGVALLAAFVLGVMADSLGTGQRVNILAPPLIGLLLWNLGVYLALLAHVALPTGSGRPGPLRRGIEKGLARVFLRLDGAAASAEGAGGSAGKRSSLWPAALRFGSAWAELSRPLQSARLAGWLHAAAAALAAGAITSLYLRGLAFEYLAGWSSTFLGPAAVHQLLGIVLGPAAALTGLSLPGVDELAALKFSAGPGENAARWIHLYAVTLLAAVVLPRAAMAMVSAWRARRLAVQVVLPLGEPYFERLRRAYAGQRLGICVQPFNYRLPAGLQVALHRALDERFGPGVQSRLADNVVLGASLVKPPALQPGEWLALLFSLSATPERETHGSFLQAMAASVAPGALKVLVDESGYRQRLSAADAALRLPQRRAAWQALLEETGHTPVFINLAEGAA